MTLDELAAECHQISKDHGWWEEYDRNLFEQVALWHSECSEAVEELRVNPDPTVVWYSEGGKPEGFPSEAADVLIRVLDCCGRYNIPIGKIVAEKMEFNRSRPYRHGGKIA